MHSCVLSCRQFAVIVLMTLTGLTMDHVVMGQDDQSDITDEGNVGLLLDQPPLKFQPGPDIQLKVGDNQTILLFSTETYDVVFRNASNETVLQFQYSVQENQQKFIHPLSNISISPEIFQNGTSFVILAESAGRLVVTSSFQPPLPSNYTATGLFLRISTFKVAALIVVCQVVGWIYFAAWSISFYPQIYQNYRRQSVRGLSFEFVFLNVTGFLVYTVYNVGLYLFVPVQKEYLTEDPTGAIPVQLNDVVFSVHALFACIITGIQCFIYDRGSQTFSHTGRCLVLGICSFIFIMVVVALSNAITWLTFLQCCSYVKLFVTFIKYMPQAYLNYSRKSTSGWSIGNVLLDFTGGVFSLLQMLLIAYNHDDWFEIPGDFTKFGLGLFSVCFDLFFMVQHYILYRNHEGYEPIEGCQGPVFNPHEDMITSHQFQEAYAKSAVRQPRSFPETVDVHESPEPDANDNNAELDKSSEVDGEEHQEAGEGQQRSHNNDDSDEDNPNSSNNDDEEPHSSNYHEGGQVK